MKRFFEDCIDLIIRMVITQIGLTMFGTMLALVARKLPGAEEKERDPMLILVSVVAIGLYLFLLYVHTWEKGARDKIKVDGGRMKKSKYKGLYASLVANSINIILGLIMCISHPFCNFDAAPYSTPCQLFGSANLIARFIQGMYLGLIRYFYPDALNTPPIIFILITLPAILISFVGYYLGSENKGKLKIFDTTPSK